MHVHIVPSEPSVTVAERAKVTRGFLMEGAVEYWQQLLQSHAVALKIALLPWACQLKAPVR